MNTNKLSLFFFGGGGGGAVVVPGDAICNISQFKFCLNLHICNDGSPRIGMGDPTTRLGWSVWRPRILIFQKHCSRRDVMRLSNKRSPYLFGVATANRTKVTTPNKYGAEIIARMSDWENGCQSWIMNTGASHPPKLVTPTTPSCIDNSWRSTTLPAADSASSNQTLPFQNEHKWVLQG